jgi:hypothetical protein
MGQFSLAKLFGMTIRESANDGSDFTNPDADFRRLFLGEDGLLHVKDSSGTVTNPYIGASTSFLGYNTVGGSTQTMTQGRVYATQITAGSGGNTLLGVQAYVDQTAEALWFAAFFLHADSGSDTIGDLIQTAPGGPMVLAHGTGGGISYPARWLGAAFGYPLAASTKYWLGVVYHSGTGAPRLYYDGSGSDRYYTAGVTPYYNDGAYNAGAQTNTTNKHSIRGLVL